MNQKYLQSNQNQNTLSRNKCRLEMARLHGRLDQYEAALAIYEELGYSALESRLVKYSADEYFFRAGLCHLAIDWYLHNYKAPTSIHKLVYCILLYAV